MHPIITPTEKLLSVKSNPKTVSKEDVSSFLRFALDSLTLMAHSVYEVNLSRLELIRPDLNEQYKQLCSSQTQISKFLFGDDLPKAVEEISETNKVSQRLSYPKQGTNSKHGSNNFRQQGSSYSNRQHFLYQGQGQRRKPPSKFKIMFTNGTPSPQINGSLMLLEGLLFGGHSASETTQFPK